MDQAETIRVGMFGRKQYDEMVKAGAFEQPLSCPMEEEEVRKEFARESSVMYQLEMFGAGQAFPRLGASGVIDFDLDRLRAMELLQEADYLFGQLPKVVREKYSNWGQVEIANATGELVELLQPPGSPAA